MKFSTIIYCLKQSIKNILSNIRFSLASLATIMASIFLFCLFFSLISNLSYIVKNAESNIGISILFDENLSEEEILDIGDEIKARAEVKNMEYISAVEAWNNFKNEYFGDKVYLAEGFEDDNPLAGSASYTIFLNDISAQNEFISYLKGITGIREVNYSAAAVSALTTFNKFLVVISGFIVGLLIAVSTFLISNTISLGAQFRRNENEIMRLVGATNAMISAPFIIEGTLIGFMGAVIPLIVVRYVYARAVSYIVERFDIFNNIFNFLPLRAIFPRMTFISLALGIGTGFLVSAFTIRKHLKV